MNEGRTAIELGVISDIFSFWNISFSLITNLTPIFRSNLPNE